MADTTSPNSPEKTLDGYDGVVVKPASPGTSEFAATTEVIFVNGIGSDLKASTADAQRLADLTHDSVRLLHVASKGIFADIVHTAEEKLGRAKDKPEAALTTEVLKHLRGHEFVGDVHFYAHSRGALVVQRGLEQVERDLRKEHFTPEEIRDVMSHVTVETAGGASLGMPKGVRTVNYVDSHDSIANILGVGSPSTKDIAVLDAVVGATGVAGPEVSTVAKIGVETYLLAKPLITHPNGPIVDVPAVGAKPGSGPLGDLLANHAANHYLDYRRPFEQTYATAPRGGHVDFIDPSDPRLVMVKKAEEMLMDRLANGPRTSAVELPLRTALEGLAANGGLKLPAPASIVPDEHRSQRGTFVAIDDRTVALHTGRGAYEIFDVSRDLQNRVPPIGRTVDVSAQGVVHEVPARTLDRTN